MEKRQPSSLIIRNAAFLTVVIIAGACLVTSHTIQLGLTGARANAIVAIIIVIFSAIAVMTLYLEFRRYVATLNAEIYDRLKSRQGGESPDGSAPASQTDLRLASHQMRSPIVAVQSVLKVLLSGEIKLDDDVAKNLLQQALARSDDMLYLVNGLLHLEEIKKEANNCQCETVDAAAELSSIVNSLKIVAAERGISINLDISGAPPSVCLPGKQLKHIFTNLVENAVKYSNDNSAVDVSLESGGGNVLRFEVTDRGIGIPDSAKENLYTEFYRADNARMLRGQGSGLGLAIVKNIVEQHRGTITFDSTEGAGTRFTVVLPDGN